MRSILLLSSGSTLYFAASIQKRSCANITRSGNFDDESKVLRSQRWNVVWARSRQACQAEKRLTRTTKHYETNWSR